MGRGPSFVLLMEGPGLGPAAERLIAAIEPRLRAVLGFSPRLVSAPLFESDALPVGELGLPAVDRALDEAADAGSEETFLLPVVLELDIHAKQQLVASVREAQRRRPSMQVYYDEVDPCHPLLLHAFVDAAARALGERPGALPGRTGLLLVASGDGDPSSRAEAYKLMRLLWEQLACIHADVAFLRHDRVPLPEQLHACARRGVDWILVPRFLWRSKHLQYAEVIAGDFARSREGQHSWPLAAPIGDHPNVAGWVEQRALELWRQYQSRRAARLPSARRAPLRPAMVFGPRERRPLLELERGAVDDSLRYGSGMIADIPEHEALARLLDLVGLDAPHVLVKVTWHGYAPGTYTDPIALDALLRALPGRAVILEGHTSGRNLGGAAFDWEADCRAHRTWIAGQDREYLERTGLRAVIEEHGATYLNVTEAYWDGACAEPDQLREILDEAGISLEYEELLGFVPSALLAHRGAPMLSFARFKGPTRLSTSNLFGLLPAPLRSAWHGPNMTYMAKVSCELARLYGCLFDLHGMVESLSVAVRWDRRGLYRSRWGNYDLVHAPGLVTLAPSVAIADVLASRLQGQDVRRSAFFDVVAEQLGFPESLATAPIDDTLVRRFA